MLFNAVQFISDSSFKVAMASAALRLDLLELENFELLRFSHFKLSQNYGPRVLLFQHTNHCRHTHPSLLVSIHVCNQNCHKKPTTRCRWLRDRLLIDGHGSALTANKPWFVGRSNLYFRIGLRFCLIFNLDCLDLLCPFEENGCNDLAWKNTMFNLNKTWCWYFRKSQSENAYP